MLDLLHLRMLFFTRYNILFIIIVYYLLVFLARYLQSDDNYVQWTPELRVLTFTKSKGDKVIGIRFREVTIKAAESSLSEEFPSTVPIIVEILPNTPAASCPCLWINDHLLCIKGYVYTEGGKELENVISKCTYVQIVVQRAVRTYGPEKVVFIPGRRQKFGITFREKKNLFHGKLCTMISAFSPREENEYLEKGLELKSVITSINDRPLSDLPLRESVSVLRQEALLQEIKLRFCTLHKFAVGLKKDPGIGLALVTSLGSVQKLVLNESPSPPFIGASQPEDPLRSVFPLDAQHYNYLKVYILGVSLYEDVYELVGRLVNDTQSPRSASPGLGDSCFQGPEFSPDLYPHCSLLGELFRSASSDERVLTELDLDSDWRPVSYAPVLCSLQYPDFSVRSPTHKSPPHRKPDGTPSAISALPEFGVKRPTSISLITPSSSNSSLSSELAPDLLVRYSQSNCRLPSPAISLVVFRNTRELTSLPPSDLFPLFKRTGMYVMVINLEKIFSFFEKELHFYLKILTELHSLPFPDPVKVFVVGLYDGLSEQTVRSLCRSLHGLLESLFNSHVVMDSKKFETCVFPIRRSDRNMDTVYVLRRTLFAFSRANSICQESQETDLAGMLRIPDNFKKFRVCSLLQSTVPLLLSEQIGQILVETEVPDHQLEIALRALVECTPFCAPETLSDLSEEGLLLRPGIFLRILRQLEKWSGGEGLDRTPEQREVCKQLRDNCYFNLSVLVRAIMQSCSRLSQIARALLRWMEKLNFAFIIGGPVSVGEFEKLCQYKAMTPKPGTKTVKVFMPSIALWNDYKKVDTSTIFTDAHVFYLDISDPISSRFYFLILTELLRVVHRSNLGSISPTREELVVPPLYDFQLSRGANIARLFDQEMLGCNLEIINRHDQFQIEFRAKFGSTPSQALPNLLGRVYSCAMRALAKMSLADKGFNIGIGPACPVDGCPGKRKTSELSRATVGFVRVINDLHPARTKGMNFPEVNPGSLPCWGRPGVHVIDLSVHFRHPSKTVTHYSQCQDRIMAPDSPFVCCPQHTYLKDWVPRDLSL